MMNQREKIIAYVEQNGSITSYDAYEKLGITQLGARIFELKRDGYCISAMWKENPRTGKHYVEYKIVR